VIGEILTEIAHEIQAEPARFIAEIVQFVLLICIIWVVAYGFGSRRGFVRNMLSERQKRTVGQLETAMDAPGALEQAKLRATGARRSGRTEARRIVGKAKREATEQLTASTAEADREADHLLARVDETLENERSEMEAEMRERLVEIVAQATRHLLNERMTVAEQRRLIEEHVRASVSEAAGPDVARREKVAISRAALPQGRRPRREMSTARGCGGSLKAGRDRASRCVRALGLTTT